MTGTLRPELARSLPPRMGDLPIDPERGFPVPWFVEWIDGKPEFRVMSGAKWARAVRDKLCWVCGKQLGGYLCFVLGPMCGITRTTSEPPCHRECAQWSARFCPFLSRPHMTRRGEEQLEEMGAESPGGFALKRKSRRCAALDDARLQNLASGRRRRIDYDRRALRLGMVGRGPAGVARGSRGKHPRRPAAFGRAGAAANGRDAGSSTASQGV